GDIVAFRRDNDARGVFIKRVIGIPGDRVKIAGGHVYVNGIALQEPYVEHGDDRSAPEVVVPPHSVYVLGDNRAASEDSRVFGPVPDDRLMGRAVAGVWPPRMLGGL
ncbi:MAG: signal peptidase I, partial [Candidatus Eremiobacteraeota bacterium]|nr:signal peptidase I [Candidatus Eremiobacteraeota bacterium]MBV9264083.1 signal peptidase I [Candidatus Eremiobacteraeota bacterium]